MSRPVNSLAFCTVVFLSAALTSAQPSPRRDILTFASGKLSDQSAQLWAAWISDTKTRVFARQVLGDSKWTELRTLPARAVSMTGHSDELVLLLENGTWAWFSASEQMERFSYGPPLPDGSKILSLAGDRKTLLAIGQAPPPESQPPPGTQPATRPPQPIVYRLVGPAWQALPAPWPQPARISYPQQLSLELIDEQPWLAIRWPEQVIRLYALSKDAMAWTPGKSIPAPTELGHFRILNLAGRAGLWLQAGNGPGTLCIPDQQMVPLALTPPLPQPRDADLTAISDQQQLRLIFRRGSGLYEQRYKLDGAEEGQPVAMQITRHRTEPSVTFLAMIVMSVLAVFLIISLLRRRPTPPDQDTDDEES